MIRIFATIIKEWHLLRRDLGGIALLFFMPVLLIIIMALVQDGPFKDYQSITYKALILNNDPGKVSNEITQGLQQSKQFILQDNYQNQPLSVGLCKQLVQEGRFAFAIIIPKGIQAEVVNSANLIANEIGKQMGLPNSLPHRAQRDSVQVQLVFDPTSKPAFKMAITNVLEKFISKIQSDIVLERISALSQTKTDTSNFDFEKTLHSVSIAEISTKKNQTDVEKMNSVQHNVPAWAIFGIFFLTVIISESLIQERQTGSWTRLKLIPGSFAHLLIGKMLFFISLGVLQFIFMLAIGVFLMPLIGLQSLQLSHSPFLLLLVIICISTCATCTGILIGSFFNTTKQALPFSALIIVILSAIGGIWVPLEILPPFLKSLSVLSPMRWSLEAINQLLLREGSLTNIFYPCLWLIIGSVISLTVARILEDKRRY